MNEPLQPGSYPGGTVSIGPQRGIWNEMKRGHARREGGGFRLRWQCLVSEDRLLTRAALLGAVVRMCAASAVTLGLQPFHSFLEHLGRGQEADHQECLRFEVEEESRRHQ